MKKNLLLALLPFFLFSCSITKKTEENKIESSTGANIQVENKINSPFEEQEKNAPNVDDSIKKIGLKILDEPIYKSCVARTVEMCSSELISRFAIEKDSDDVCNNFTNEDLQDTCKNAINSQLALKNNDNTYCSKLDIINKTNCEEQVIISKAIKDQDVKICDGLIKDILITDSKEIDKISLINNESKKDQCIMQVINNIPNTYKTLLLCNNIVDKIQKESCQDIIKSRIEMEKQLKNLKDEIINIQDK